MVTDGSRHADGAGPAVRAGRRRRPRRQLLRRWTLGVVAVLVVALVSAAGLVAVAVRAPVPDRDGRVELAGLDGEVEVVRDALGVPHVYADTAEDLFLAQGYVHAQDRFFEMDLRRHITAGRLSELVGEDPDALQADVVVRTLGWRRTAEAELAGLDPDSRRYLAAYAAGVDAYTAGRSPRELSLAYTVLGLQVPLADVEPWTPADSLAWLKALAWDLRSNYSAELGRGRLLAGGTDPDRVEQLYPPYPPNHPSIVRAGEVGGVGDAAAAGSPAPLSRASREALAAASEALAALGAGGRLAGTTGEGLGSNSWVVSGDHTATGAPLLANDPHLAPASPSTFHQVGLHCREVDEDCPFDVTGFSFSGLPGVFIGQTPDVAWGLTTLYADHTDFYVERLVGDAQERDGRLVPLEVHEEVVTVAGGEPVTVRVREGVNGPILSDALPDLAEVTAVTDDTAGDDAPDDGPDVQHGVALRWTATEPGTTMDAVFAINRARSATDVVRAARLLDVPGQNIVLAEAGAGGTIGYVTPGAVPVRAAGDGLVPVPGWDSRYDWQGEVPREDLPVVLDPPRGWLATANNAVLDPSGPAAAGLRIGDDTDYGYRARRIEERLHALVDRGDVTAQDLLDVQGDTTSPLADVLVPFLLAAVDGSGPADPDGSGARTAAALALLEDWDGTQPVDSAAAAYAAAVWSELLRVVFHDELPEDLRPDGGSRWVRVVTGLLETPQDQWWDDVGTAEVETRDDVLAAVATSAADLLAERLDEPDPAAWRWGDLHTLEPTHTPLGGDAVPGPVRGLFNLDEHGVAGGAATVVATSWDAAAGFEVTSVPSMRMVVDLADRDASRWLDLTGVSGHPTDRYHGNQWSTWVEGGTAPMPVTREAVAAVARERLLLTPAGAG